jgi:CBS domain-containing protein
MSLSQFRRPLATADVRDSVEQAAGIMRDRGVGCLVVTEKDRPVGIVTDRDLVIRVLAQGLGASGPIGEYTTYAPLTVSIHDNVETAATCMRTHGIRRIPIVDDEGKAVGIVTADDLLMLLGRGLADVCEGIENRADATESQ